MIERNFRHMPEAGFPAGIFEAPVNPLILVSKSGTSNFYQAEHDKKNVLAMFCNHEEVQQDSMLLFVWQGKMRSDVFEITLADANSILWLKAE